MLRMLIKKNKNMIISYKTLRTLIGILGMLLPIICIFGGLAFAKVAVQDSISQYYHTNMRDFFVGLMFCVSIFLVTYHGHELIDDIITILIGIAGFGTALFPCLFIETSTQPVGIFQINPATSNIIHTISAVSFFILLAINSFFLFPLSKNKKIRNLIYKSCGVIIFVSLITLFIIYLSIGHKGIIRYHITIIIESIMLLAFGVSWLVKGLKLKPEKQEKN